MADQRDPMSKILDNVEKDIQSAPASLPAQRPPSANVVESFAPQKYRNEKDTMEQIQQDFRKAVAELEQRFKALADELKRITG